MALRSEPAVTVPITGPRSRAVAAPQRMGKRLGVPAPGCEVSRIWPLRLVVMASRVLAASQNAKGPSPTKPNERPPTNTYSGVKPARLQGVAGRAPLILRCFSAWPGQAQLTRRGAWPGGGAAPAHGGPGPGGAGSGPSLLVLTPRQC